MRVLEHLFGAAAQLLERGQVWKAQRRDAGVCFLPGAARTGGQLLGGRVAPLVTSGAQAVKVEGTEYLVMREDDIMGVVAK